MDVPGLWSGDRGGRPGGLSGGRALQPGESAYVVVSYTPTDELSDDGWLRVTSDAVDTPDVSVSVRGTGGYAAAWR